MWPRMSSRIDTKPRSAGSGSIWIEPRRCVVSARLRPGRGCAGPALPRAKGHSVPSAASCRIRHADDRSANEVDDLLDLDRTETEPSLAERYRELQVHIHLHT